MRMKQALMWFITALFAVCLAGIINRQEPEVVSEQNHPERTESSVMSPQRQQHSEAILADAMSLYRICSYRPQRILPTLGSRSERTLMPSFHIVRQHFVKPLRSYFDSRCRRETAPFCLSALCDYYVIALRHIIR